MMYLQNKFLLFKTWRISSSLPIGLSMLLLMAIFYYSEERVKSSNISMALDLQDSSANTTTNLEQLGLNISSPTNLGLTRISRRNESVLIGQQYSVKKILDIQPTFDQDLDASFDFYYNDLDLAGLDKKNLILYSSIDNGTTWTPHLNSVSDTLNNKIHLEGIDHFSLWTAAPPPPNPTETFPAGSYIIDMGVEPQTIGNAIKPYGLLFTLLDEYKIPVAWAIRDGKGKDEADFSYEGREIKAGSFIVNGAYRTPEVDSVLLAWEAKGVVGITVATEFSAPIAMTINYSLEWTLDRQTGGIVAQYFDYAEIPETAYNWKLPSEMDDCEDVFVMPHADPTWEMHGDLLRWNAPIAEGGNKGSIWVNCHAVSVLENVFNPANPLERMNFLMQDPPGPGQEAAVDFGDHDDGSLPPAYQYDYHDDIMMQFLGTIDAATQNGSEQIYLPRVGWRPTTKILVWDDDHPEVPALSPGPASVFAYGHGFGDTDRGLVFYQGGHSLSGTGPDNIAAMRALLNFSFRAASEKAFAIETNIAPSGVIAEGEVPAFSAVVSGFTGDLVYEWSSSCGGTFTNPFGQNTEFIPPSVSEPVTCVINCLVYARGCPDREGFASIPLFVVPPPTAPTAVDDYTSTSPEVPVLVTALDNDFDINLDPLTFTPLSSLMTANGTFVNLGNGIVSYVSNASYVGGDTLQYEICDTTLAIDGGPFCDTAMVIIDVNYFDENGCFPSQTFRTLYTGYADDFSDNTFVGNPERAVGFPDAQFATIEENDDREKRGELTLYLTDVIPKGDTVFLSISGSDGNTANTQVSASLGGSTFTDASIFSVAGTVFQEFYYIVNQADGIDFLRFEMYDNIKNLRVDAVSYKAKTCVDNCSLPEVGISLAGTGDNFEVSSTAGNPAKAIGIPDFDGAEVDGANSEILIIDLGDTIPDGALLELFLANNGSPATFQVTGSFDQISYNDVQTFTANIEKDNFTQFIYSVNQSSGIKYLKFEVTNGVKGFVDAITYDFYACVDGRPEAVDDQDFTRWSVPTTWRVQANDFEPQNEAMTTTILAGPTNGVAVVNSDGSITYTPDFGFTGNDTLRYEVCDLVGLCDDALFVISVVPGCSLGETFTQTVKSYGYQIVSSNLVNDPTFSIGMPDDERAQIDKDGGELILQLNQNVTPGDTIWVYLSGQDGNPAATTVEGSSDGISFTNLTTFTPSGTIFTAYPYRIEDLAGVEYLRIANNNGNKNSRVDAVEYQGAECLVDCVLPDVQVQFTGLADAFDFSSTAANPDLATGVPNFSGAEIDGANADVLIIDLSDTIPQGFSIFFYMADDGTTATMNVSGSTSNTGFSDTVAFTTTSEKDVYAQFKYVVTQTSGVRFLRLEESTGLKAFVDGFEYLYFLCENGRPAAVNDFIDTAEDVPVNMNVQANDSDPQNDPLTTTILNQPTNGNAALELDGSLTYYPGLDFSGLDTITYVVCDLTPLCDTAIYEINVIPDACSAVERHSIIAGYADLVAKDIGIDNEENTLGYPDQQYARLRNQNDELVLRLEDLVQANFPIRLFIGNNTGTTAQGTIEGSADDLIYNDLTTISAPTLISLGQDTIVFTPTFSTRYLRISWTSEELMIDAAGYKGRFGPCEAVPVNQAPIANQDNESTGLNSPVSLDVSLNDIEPEYGVISSVNLLPGYDPALNGSVSISGTIVTYTPTADFVGVDTFSYSICDNYAPLLCDTAIVIIETLCTDPANENGIQGRIFDDADFDGSYSIIEGVRVGVDVILYEDLDLSNTVTIGDLPLDTTRSDANGQFYFNILAPDIPSTLIENIPGNADDAVENLTCYGCALSVGSVIDDDLKINFGGDPSGQNGEDLLVGLRFAGINIPSGAVVQSASIDFTAFPDGASNTSPTIMQIYGEDIDDAPSFDNAITFDISSRVKTDNFASWFNISEWQLDSVYTTPDLSTILQEIIDRPGWSNGQDVAFIIESEGLRQAYSRDEDANKAPDLQISYTIPGNASYVMEVDTNSISFFDSVTTVNNLQEAVFNLRGQVDCDNDFGIYEKPNTPPVTIDDTVSMTSDTLLAIAVLDNDFDPEGGVTVIILNPDDPTNNGTTALKGDSILYIPDIGFTGSDTFSYILCDFGTPPLCDTAEVMVTVDNETPVATDNTATTESEVTVFVNVLSDDSDKETPNVSLSFAIIGSVANGTAIAYSDGTISYISNAGFTGLESIQYEICDDGTPVQCDTALLDITVTPLLNSAPIAADDAEETFMNQGVFVNVKGNDFEPENDSMIIMLDPGLQQPGNGVLALLPNGLISYQPDSAFAGIDSFQYIVCDDRLPALCDTAMARLEVVNRPPRAYVDDVLTSMNTSLSIDVLINDIDEDLGMINITTTGVTGIGGASQQGGTVLIDDNGTTADPSDDFIRYTPSLNYIGLDTFQYIICDDATIPICDTTSVFIEVTPPIDLEVSVTVDQATANVGDTITFTVTVFNNTSTDATTVSIKDKLPGSYSYISNDQGSFYDPGIGSWYIGNLDSMATTSLNIIAVLLDFQDTKNIAQVVTADQGDVDSSPNNDDGDQSEDDEDFADVTLALPPCSDCSAASCISDTITSQITAYTNVDGIGTNQGCHPLIARSVNSGDTVTFCSTITTPAVLEEDYISFFGSVPLTNIGCNATRIKNWELTSNCTPVISTYFSSIKPNLPNNLSRPIWPVLPNTTYEMCYDVILSGICDSVSTPCFAAHWVAPPCDLLVYTSDHDCSRNDGTFDLLINFSNGGQGAGTYTLTNNGAGTLSGDDPNVDTSGAILISNIPDGSGYDFELLGDNINSGCIFNITSASYTCSFCPKITTATVAQDECVGNTVTLTATVDQGTEGQDYYIEWLVDGNPINQSGSSTVGLDGIYGTADDPATSLTYVHTLSFNGSPGSCSYEDQVFTARLYCKTSETLQQGDINVASTTSNVIANYNALSKTCLGLDLTSVPVGIIAENFEYQYRVTSGPPFGLSWICEAVLSVETPAGVSCPLCHPFWAGTCPTQPAGASSFSFPSGPNATSCFGGPGNGAGTSLNPVSGPLAENLGGINSTIPARGNWEVCVFDTYNDNNNSTEGVLNYIYIKVNYFLPPGIDVNFAVNSIVDAVNVSSPIVSPSAPLTTVAHPQGAGLVTGLRVCNTPVTGVDFTLPDFNNCETAITVNCSGGVVRYSSDNGASYLLAAPLAPYVSNQVIYYQVTTLDCAFGCGATGTYTLNCNTPPVILYAPDTTFDEHATSIVIDVVSTDNANGESDSTLVYSLAGIDQNFFNIDSLTGEISFLSPPDYETPLDDGLDNIYNLSVIVCDVGPLCDTALIAITVIPINERPIAISDINTTAVNEMVSGNVLTNDSDIEGDSLSVNPVPLNPFGGAVTIDSAGNYVFTPDPGYEGEAGFEYIVCDNGIPSSCDTVSVIIQVIDNTNTANNNVAGIEDYFLTENDNPLRAQLLANDSDPDGDSLMIDTVAIILPTNGTLIINSDGSFVYTPNTGFVGEDIFEYEVCDSGSPQSCDTVEVVIEVLFSNAQNNLYATDDAQVGIMGDSLTGDVSLNDNDPSSGILTINSIPLRAPVNGTLLLNNNGTYTYQPTVGFFGNDRFVYEVCDNGTPVACDSATVYLTVLDNRITLDLRVMLQGALIGSTDSLMRADLVAQNLVPLQQPYDTASNVLFADRFVPALAGTETTTLAVLNANSGTPDGLVDWVFIELRDAADSLTVIRTIAALVQRDGDIVEASTGSTLYATDLPAQFFVVIKHRNHLGTMTANPVSVMGRRATVGFISLSDAQAYHSGLYDSLEQSSLFGLRALWGGNFNADEKTKYDGSLNDRIILSAEIIQATGNTLQTLNYDGAVGYYQSDINLDGKIKYDGIGNDRILLQGILFGYPGNSSYLNNYNEMIEQIKQ